MATLRSVVLRPGLVRDNAPFKNGLGRFIPQIQRLTIKFNKDMPNSLGVRQFIEKEIVPFAEQHPHVAIYLKPRLRAPQLVAEYCNGEKHQQPMANLSQSEVANWINLLMTHSGREDNILDKPVFSENPSIQGVWNPYTNADPKIATATFPDEDLSRPFGLQPTASEMLAKMFEGQQKSKDGGSQ